MKEQMVMVNPQQKVIDYMWDKNATEDGIRKIVCDYLYDKMENERDWYTREAPEGDLEWNSETFYYNLEIHTGELIGSLHSLWNELIEPIRLEEDCLHVAKNIREALYLLQVDDYIKKGFWAYDGIVEG